MSTLQMDGAETITLHLWRGDDAGGDGAVEVVVVPWDPGMTLLDAMLWVRRNRDPNLAFDYSCVTNNSCKLCQARINGAVGYLCTEVVEPGTFEIEPIRREMARDIFLRRRDMW